jgi:hypothetical protein
MTDETETPAPRAVGGGRDEGAHPGQAARYPNTEIRDQRQGASKDLALRTHRGEVFRVRIDATDPHWRAKALAALGPERRLSPLGWAIASAPHTEAEALQWAQICEEEEKRRAYEAKLSLLLALIQRRRTLNALRAKWGRKL